MSVYKTGRSADYQGAESKPPKRVYQPRKPNITGHAIAGLTETLSRQSMGVHLEHL